MNEGIKVPLAEHFHSLQGEGRWCGLPMHFLRLPGCTVGRQHLAQQDAFPPLPILSTGAPAKVCTAYDGREFFCDTDYAKHEEQNLALLIAETWERDVCFTGGEPLMHEGKLWYKSLYNAFRYEARVHIETSGTIDPKLQYDWLTVSPKKDWIPSVVHRADQVKILIDSQTNVYDVGMILNYVSPSRTITYFSPIFDPNEFVQANFDKCQELLKEFSTWRPQVSVQVHKFLGLR